MVTINQENIDKELFDRLMKKIENTPIPLIEFPKTGYKSRGSASSKFSLPVLKSYSFQELPKEYHLDFDKHPPQ